MTFNSLSYFLFLPIVYLIFYFSSDRWRWLVLLLASYGFYASFEAPYLLAVLLMVTGISYVCGLKMAAHKDESIRNRWLWIGSFACVGILALLKYIHFLESQVNSIFGLNSTISSAIISIGVSYFTFQAISYLTDIYLEVEEPEQHFGRFALYLAFFPKLLQGPIERASDLLPQLNKPYQFDYDAMRSGMLLFTWGLFKKLVVADHVALYADQVYNNVYDYSGLSLIIGTYAYALQIYFDFAGYTDMARGTGRMFGIGLTENFNSPYLSTSIADFWRRWHISFSRWILDYIFKPMQMGWRDWGQSGTALALMVTFLVSGIWHGATWGFVIWGLIHGIYLAASTYYRPYQKRLYKWLGIEKSIWLKWWQIFVTFNLVCFAWVFFRANGKQEAIYVLENLPALHNNFLKIKESGWLVFVKQDILLGLGHEFIRISICLIFYWVIVKNKTYDLLSKPSYIRWLAYNIIILMIILFQISNKKYIYFQF